MALWRIDEVEVREATLDLRSSGQGLASVTQLVVDGEVLANAVGVTAWSGERAQVEVCAECAVLGCATGGWVSPRRAGDHLLWLPVFEAMLEEETSFGPPSWFARRGVPWFSPSAVATLGHTIGDVVSSAPPLTTREVVSLMQWTAPGGVLGVAPGVPRVAREVVLAISVGDREATLDQLDALLDDASRSAGGGDGAPAGRSEATLREPPDGAERVGLFLDLPEHPEWSPLVRVEDRPALALDGLMVVASR